MPVLKLGVIDLPYGQDRDDRTTGDVAELLEAKYHVMEIFAQEKGQEIADAVGESLLDFLESQSLGAPVQDGLKQAETDIEAMFQAFLTQGDIERLGYPGVPTGAAKKGVNHRLKHPYKKSNPRRVSFVDTGLYSSSFRVWHDAIPGATEYGWGFASLEGLYA